jgi:endonuclease I
MKKFVLLLISFTFLLNVQSQIPAGYYDSAQGLIGTALKSALHNIIKNHTAITYANLWTAYLKTDIRSDGYVWDMYSDIPGGTPPYVFTFVTDQCGSSTAEGDCYNREHSFPSSWFDDSDPMRTDLFHIVPTDGWVNNKRGNYPYGDVGTASWTSQNGSMLGACIDSGYAGTVFEPIDSFKGDFARNILYMAVRYYTEDAGWTGSDMVTGAEPKVWAIKMLKEWNNLDPVSHKEHARNDSIYKIQHNRNPFIDNPQWVDSVWCGPVSISDDESISFTPFIYPNPAANTVNFEYYSNMNESIEITIWTFDGRKIIEKHVEKNAGNFSNSIDLKGISKGIYFLISISKDNNYIKKLIIQ